MGTVKHAAALAGALAAALVAAPSSAQTYQAPGEGTADGQRPPANEPPPLLQDPFGLRPPVRIRLMLGPQFTPGFPGDDGHRLSAVLGFARAAPDEDFLFGAPGDGAGFRLARFGRTEFGPLARFEGRRRENDLVPGLPTVGRTVELGGFVQTWVGDSVRLRADLRQGIGGHRALVSQIGADFVQRDRDRWLWSVGPRAFLSDGAYQRRWFGVTPADSLRSGLATFRPGGGLHGLGATGVVNFALTPTWGIQGQATYMRLVDDAARSPAIRAGGSRNQLGVGFGITYTFTRN